MLQNRVLLGFVSLLSKITLKHSELKRFDMSLLRLGVVSPDTIGRTLDEWLRVSPGMGVLALLPEAEKHQLPLVQSACRDRSVPLVGAIFPALVTLQGFSREGAWLLRIDEMIPTFLPIIRRLCRSS